MNYRPQIDAYFNSATISRPEDQLLALYDRAISFLRQAHNAIVTDNFEGRYNLVQKTRNIIHGLDSILDVNNKDSDVVSTAETLRRYYDDVDNDLLYIQGTSDPQKCERIIESLRRLRNAFAKAIASTDQTKKAEANAEIVL